MKYTPDIHQRRSIRLKGYDYSQEGLYFITICTQNKLCLFGEIKSDGRGTMHRAPTNIEKFGKPTSNTIPTIIRSYKSSVTKQINILRNVNGVSVWQRNYYEHIIRNEKSYLEISEYIINNPLNW
jgi:REP element-mobilizing transposase RayT